MASTNLDIANAALVKLGEMPITDWDDTGKAGRLIRAAFFRLRDAELQAARWKFALARTSLPALSAAPVFGFARAFQLPTDYLALVQLGEWDISYLAIGPEYRGRDVATWSIEGDAILTDEAAPLALRYVRRIEDPTLFDPLFDDALAVKLAMELADAIAQSSERKQLLGQEYTLAIRRALRANAIEKHPAYPSDGPWLMSRVMG